MAKGIFRNFYFTFYVSNTTNKTMKILLLGSGELGKEFAIAAQRIGQTIIAVDTLRKRTCNASGTRF